MKNIITLILTIIMILLAGLIAATAQSISTTRLPVQHDTSISGASIPQVKFNHPRAVTVKAAAKNLAIR